MIWCICLLVLTLLTGPGESKFLQQVTCGSVIKLINAHYGVRLHSHDVNYGSGSGQQSVTGVESATDFNSHWLVQGKSAKASCVRGEVVKCGDEIRLLHQATRKNLHSHHFTSPLTDKQEISAFGDEAGQGDTGDLWKVVCSYGDAWARDDPVALKHVDTGAFLAASGRTFGRPIFGQMEIVGLPNPTSTTRWKTAEGIYVHPSQFDPTGGKDGDKHDEL